MTLPAQAACARRAVRGERGSGRPLSSKKARAASAFTSTPYTVAARASQSMSRFSAQGHKDASGRSPAAGHPRRAGRSCGGRGGGWSSRGAPGGTAPTGRSTCRAPWRAPRRRRRHGEILHGDAIQPDWASPQGSYPKRAATASPRAARLSVGSARAASPATPATATPPARSLGHRRAGEASVAPSGAAALPVGLASEVAREVVNFLRGRARTRAPSSPPSPRRRNRPRSPNHSPRGGDAHDMSARALSGRRAGDRPFPRRPR